MKKSTKGEVVLTAYQIQATRLNKLEYHRLQHNINLMQNNLQEHLTRLKRQAQGLRYHYTNVIRVVKPNPAYQLWKQAHAYEIAQDEIQDWLESMKLKQKSKSQTREQVSSSNKVSSEPVRPLLVLLGNNAEKPAKPIINLSENFLRPKTSPINKLLPNQHRVNPLMTIFNEHSMNLNNLLQPQSYEFGSISSLPSILSSGSRKFVQGKVHTTQKTSNLDVLYRIVLQHRTLRGNMRSAGIVK